MTTPSVEAFLWIGYACSMRLACFFLILVGCSTPTQIVVIVRSDLPDVAQVDVQVESATETKSGRYLIGDTVQIPFSFTVVPADDLGERTIRVSARDVSVSRATRFVSERRVALPIFLSARCAGVTCAPGTSCNDGACVDLFVDPDTLPNYEPGLESRDAQVSDSAFDALGDASVDTLDPPVDTSVDTSIDTSIDTGCPSGRVDLNGDPADGCECVIEDELCDAVDNDCDPSTPDGAAEPTFGAACDGDDVDLCELGTVRCTDGELTCDDSPESEVEVCNGVDDNCNGDIDEDMDHACEACSRYVAFGSTYQFCETPSNWEVARDQCRAMGYELATIGDEAEHLNLATVGRSLPLDPESTAIDNAWWMGLNDREVEDAYVWVDGNVPVGDFVPWGTGQPTDRARGESTRNCVALRPQAVEGPNWNDGECVHPTKVYRYLCEVRND